MSPGRLSHSSNTSFILRDVFSPSVMWGCISYKEVKQQGYPGMPLHYYFVEKTLCPVSSLPFFFLPLPCCLFSPWNDHHRPKPCMILAKTHHQVAESDISLWARIQASDKCSCYQGNELLILHRSSMTGAWSTSIFVSSNQI